MYEGLREGDWDGREEGGLGGRVPGTTNVRILVHVSPCHLELTVDRHVNAYCVLLGYTVKKVSRKREGKGREREGRRECGREAKLYYLCPLPSWN